MSNVVGVLLLFGSLLLLLGAVGIVRFPDFLSRMHAATKGPSLGLVLLLVGGAIHFGTPFAYLVAALTVLAIFFTIPLSTHMLARSTTRNSRSR